MGANMVSRRRLIGDGASFAAVSALDRASATVLRTGADAQREAGQSDGSSVISWKLDVPDSVLADLRERLRITRLPNEITGDAWAYGTDLSYLRGLIDYWIERFDWRKAESELNLLPHFMATIDGHSLHFIHQRGRGPAPLPLLINHGWPGLFYEMTGLIGPLTDPARYGADPADAFDVIIPSLPGFAFSQHPGTPGITTKVIADRFSKLMTAVGYQQFGVQGGDWGATIAAIVAFQNPSRVIGLHMNTMGVRPFLGEGAKPLTPEEKAYTEAGARWRQDGGAYQDIQATRPQTLAYGLSDSPAGLAAWIVEKFRAWSDCQGNVERRFSKDQLLTNIMIFWVSNSIGSSLQLYSEQRRDPWVLRAGESITAPTAYASFPADIVPGPPRTWLERSANVQRWSLMPRGGHFAAMEEPNLLAEDIRAFFRPFRKTCFWRVGCWHRSCAPGAGKTFA
jgi:pimeloyl-ACP methyl ester carboxylesterase